MHNRRFQEQEKKGGGYVTIKRVLLAAGAAGCVYIGTRLSSPTLTESVNHAVAASSENGEVGAAIAYRVMDAALQSGKPEVVKLLGDVRTKSPDAFGRFVNLAYAVNGLNGSSAGQLDPTRLGNVMPGEWQIGQRDGTLTVDYQQPGSAPQSYAVRTFKGDNGLEIVLQRTGLAPVPVGPAPLVPTMPAAPAYQGVSPSSTPVGVGGTAAPAAYAPAPSAAPSALQSIGSMFRTVTHQ